MLLPLPPCIGSFVIAHLLYGEVVTTVQEKGKRPCLFCVVIYFHLFSFVTVVTNFQGLDHCKTVYDQSLLYVGSVDRDQSKEDKIWK